MVTNSVNLEGEGTCIF